MHVDWWCMLAHHGLGLIWLFTRLWSGMFNVGYGTEILMAYAAILAVYQGGAQYIVAPV